MGPAAIIYNVNHFIDSNYCCPGYSDSKCPDGKGDFRCCGP
jgi:hypothetical protein